MQTTSGVAYGRTYQLNKLQWVAQSPGVDSEAIAAYIDIVFSFLQSLEEKFGNERMTSDHADLSTKDAYKKVTKLFTWFKTTQLTETDAKKLVSFSTGEVRC